METEEDVRARMRGVRDGAMSAMAELALPHASARFDVYARELGLDDAHRDALWRETMLRSGCTVKRAWLRQMEGSTTQSEMFTNMPPPCYCSGCIGCGGCTFDNSDYIDPAPDTSIRGLWIYPAYHYVPPSGADDEQRRLEQAVHDYLVRIGRVPAPLPPDMLDEHITAFTDAVRPHPHSTDRVCQLVTKRHVKTQITDAARITPASGTLLIVLCGHGRADNGALFLSDGNTLSLEDVREWLTSVGFKGTVVCVVNTCHAEGGDNRDKGSTVGPAAAWPRTVDGSFKWAHVYSCSASETQVPSHAAHLARVVARLAAERPPYSELQDRVDRLWVELRDPKQPGRLWRGPPTVVTGAAGGAPYPGRFLGGA